jgi:hypothetical protein
MNPTPAEQWCRDQSVRFSGRIPDAPIESCWLSDPRFLGQSVNNPVARPAGARSPHWFDVRDTAEGSAVAQALGVNSGYFQEYAGWAPLVAWLFDTTAAFVSILAHPELPGPVRAFVLPYVFSLVEVTEAFHNQLSLQRIHAQHKGSGLEGSWRAIQAEIRLGGRNQRFDTPQVNGTLDRLRKELLTQEIKYATKSAASKRAPSAQPAGAGASTSGQKTNKGQRGQSTGPKPST